MGKIVLITGGARSGKSTFAEKIAKDTKKKVMYIATSIAFDEGMMDRIQKHRDQRPSEWTTIETYKDMDKILDTEDYNNCDVILVDCLTVMITNLMFYSELDFDNCEISLINSMEKDIAEEVRKIFLLAEKKDVIIVTNELGMGIVPSYKIGSVFRDVAGRMNQLTASKADEVYLTVCGIPMKIK